VLVAPERPHDIILCTRSKPAQAATVRCCVTVFGEDSSHELSAAAFMIYEAFALQIHPADELRMHGIVALKAKRKIFEKVVHQLFLKEA